MTDAPGPAYYEPPDWQPPCAGCQLGAITERVEDKIDAVMTEYGVDTSVSSDRFRAKVEALLLESYVFGLCGSCREDG